uniref:Uncharacterized protein n=1 Tax=Romanomermis culicivorax TaxID=13658 RepID=A0A915I9U7_ROMCU
MHSVLYSPYDCFLTGSGDKRQISKARRKSPDKAETFRAINSKTSLLATGQSFKRSFRQIQSVSDRYYRQLCLIQSRPIENIVQETLFFGDQDVQFVDNYYDRRTITGVNLTFQYAALADNVVAGFHLEFSFLNNCLKISTKSCETSPICIPFTYMQENLTDFVDFLGIFGGLVFNRFIVRMTLAVFPVPGIPLIQATTIYQKSRLNPKTLGLHYESR